MYSQTFSHTKIPFGEKVLALFLILFLGLSAPNTAVLLYAQSDESAPATTTDTTSETTEIPSDTTDTKDTDSETASDTDTSTEAVDGADGESTDTTPDTPAPEENDPAGTEDVDDTASVDTGDATSELTGTTIENTNETTANASGTSETTVSNDNDAEATTTAELVSGTGTNTAQGESSASIETGDAAASANVVNVVNTNVFNSTGLFYFLSMIMGNTSLDLRNLFSILTGNTPTQEGGCSLEGPCDNGNTTVSISNTNNAVVENNLTLAATTGGNSASASNGSAEISTGDAFASANVVNVVNTNITDTNYLLLTLNGFSPDSSNVIFPSASWFYDLLSLGTGVANGSQTTVSNINNATVTNTIATDADTGGNSATGSDATIQTGDATAGASVVNQVNQNIFGNSISFLFNIQGSWSGEIFGLPEGMSWRETGSGVEIFFDNPATASAITGGANNLSVANTNNAVVSNNISLVALTGDNEVSADGDASIRTGDAQASASVVNVVNTNILGRNWVLAIFNIFGDWDGNIAFGQPDLWIGARALAPSNLRGGSCFEYEVTVNNLGDARANNVMLQGAFNKDQQTIEKLSENANGNMRYAMGSIGAGESSAVVLPVCLSGSVGGQTTVATELSVASTEDDADYANNKEIIAVTTARGGGGKLAVTATDLSVLKTADKQTISASSSVTYEITIKNEGHPIYNSLLVDTIYDEHGKTIHEQRWGLDTILENETIVVSYEAFFNGSTAPGVYTNQAFISGSKDKNPDPTGEKDTSIDSPIASVDVTVTPFVEGTTAVCTPLLTTYIRQLGENDKKEVGELQFFLRTMAGFDSVEITNTYDTTTYDAVRSFQERYAEEILAPWGMSEPSGYVYYTTQKKINEIWCEDLDFSLSDEQKKEIETFKTRTKNFIERNVEVPEGEFDHFGYAPVEDTEPVVAKEDEQEVIQLIAENTSASKPVTPSQDQAGTVAVQSQVASVNDVYTTLGLKNIWGSIRNSIASSFSWLSF